HNDALLEQVGKPRDDDRVEEVDFKEVPVPDMKAIKWYTFHERDPGDELRVLAPLVAAVAYCQSVVDRHVQTVHVRPDCPTLSTDPAAGQPERTNLPASCAKLPSYS